ncbi:hypothetical protein E8E14_000929 [Neopestalotiopsis sp. 37M]|nr:hypothetical protein E8E14_000929 [Neopestalotiopsis sp. 37M]
MTAFEIPVVDASLFLGGDNSKRHLFSDQLRDSLTKHGFVRVKNHGISDHMIETLFDWSRKFFYLSDDIKSQVLHTSVSDPQRGWSSVGSESTAKLFRALSPGRDEDIKPDLKEHFDISNTIDSKFPNKWPDETSIPGFRPFMEDFYERCCTISMHLLEALEMSLELPPGAFMDKCREKAHELRLNRYPAITQSRVRPDVNRVWPHTDLGVITCLFQDSIGGLEVEDRAQRGTFHPIAPGGSEMIVNISETLQRWSNGKLPAGVHQVTLPPDLNTESTRGANTSIPERYSIPFFVKADYNTSVGALTQFLHDSQPSAYPDITALEFHKQRLAQAY